MDVEPDSMAEFMINHSNKRMSCNLTNISWVGAPATLEVAEDLARARARARACANTFLSECVQTYI